jgi:hypothetical protein
MPIAIITTAISNEATMACIKVALAPFLSPRPRRIAVIVIPPIAIRIARAITSKVNGIAMFTAPSASTPTPCPTKIPSTTTYRNVPHDPATVGRMYFHKLALLDPIKY